MKNNKEQNLIWIDLEMTGLNPDKDVILEIVSMVTDARLNIIEEGPSFIIHQPDEVLTGMNEWSKEQHALSGLTNAVRSSTTSVEQAEKETLAFLRKHCIPETSPLCGNSVWQDRAFMRKYMPHLVAFFHYRLIDVSSFKEIVTRWYPDSPHAEFEKKDAHRALDDTRESIEELRHYRKYFFKEGYAT